MTKLSITELRSVRHYQARVKQKGPSETRDLASEPTRHNGTADSASICAAPWIFERDFSAEQQGFPRQGDDNAQDEDGTRISAHQQRAGDRTTHAGASECRRH